MPRILIAGCGYVGQAAAALFHDAGWQVEGWTCSTASAAELSAKPYQIIAVDISRREQVAMHRAHFDAVIHCASSNGGGADAYRAIYLRGARNLLDVFQPAVLLFTSSTSVYVQTDGSWVTESSPAEPVRETGRILRETEEDVLSHGGVVARLAGIYGPGRSFLLRKFLEGNMVIDREHDHFINQVHRDDIASGLFMLMCRELQPQLGTEIDAPKIFNIVDDRPILQSECYEWLAAHLGVVLPPDGTAERKGKRGDSNKRVSNAKLRRLGWKPRYPTFQEAIKGSILPTISGLSAEG